jgi:gas vesicle protein
MKTLYTLQRVSADKLSDASDTARDLTHKAAEQAQEQSQQIYEKAQEALKQAALAAAAGGVILQSVARHNEKKARENLEDLSEQGRRAQKNVRQTLDTTQDALQDTWEDTQKSLKKGLANAQDTFQDRAKDARKSLKRARKATQETLASGLSTAQDALGSGWSATQDALDTGWSTAQDFAEEGSKRVRKGAARVASDAQDKKHELQKYYEHRQHKHERRRNLFRWGLVFGLVLALLFAPLSGAETRKRLAVLWDQYKPLLLGNSANQ